MKEKHENEGWFSGISEEFQKVIWPTRNVLIKETINVIFTCILIGIIIVAMDTVYTIGFNAFIQFLQ